MPTLMKGTTPIGALTTDSANLISYDGTNSGLAATDVQDAIDEVVTGSFIKYGEITATTTASGNIDLGVTLSDMYVLFAWVRSSNGIAMPYLQPTEQWYVRCTDNTTLSALASTSVKVGYYYIER